MANSGYVATKRNIERERDHAHDDRRDEPGDQRESGPAGVSGEIGGDRVHRPEQIGHDVTRTDSVGQLAVAP